MWTVIANARLHMYREMEFLDEVQKNALWVYAADHDLGAQLTPQFEIKPYGAIKYTCMGFANGIVVANPSCERYVVLSWFGPWARDPDR